MARALVIAAAVLATMFAGAAAPASAETDSKSDPRGDAPARVDITRLTVRNGDHRVVARIKVRDLRQVGTFNVHYWGGTTGRPPARSAIFSVRKVDGVVEATYLACGREDCQEVQCRRMRVGWRAADDLLVISTRQDCYPRPANDPEAPAPAVGRFFAYGELGDDIDSTEGLLTVQRG